MEDIILKLENITKIYPNGTVANKDINIELKKGEIHSIVGENGAGKSTLMKIIFAIEKQTTGKSIIKVKKLILRIPWMPLPMVSEWSTSILC